jgi:flagellar motor switch protein FliN/FliY
MSQVNPADATDSKEHLSISEIDSLFEQASQSLSQAADASPQQKDHATSPTPFALKDLSSSPDAGERFSMDLIGEVELDLRIELGRTQMRLEDVLQLRSGSVVALDRLAGDPVDIYVNGRLIARGEVLVMNDNFCVRVTELVAS